jgi:hypothetical protein
MEHASFFNSMSKPRLSLRMKNSQTENAPDNQDMRDKRDFSTTADTPEGDTSR